MKLDHTDDIARINEKLADATNMQKKLREDLKLVGTEVCETKKSVLDAVNKYQKIKQDIKALEQDIKSLKSLQKAEASGYGGI